MEIYDTNHRADKVVQYDKGEQRMKELLGCLWSPPSNTDSQTISLLCKQIYRNAKSNIDILPSPLHLGFSPAGWKVANQRQRSSMI